MNRLQPDIHPAHDRAPFGSAHPAAPARHPRTLTVCGTSLKALFLLEKNNESHNLLAVAVINSIADNTLRFQSEQGVWASYATENGHLSILVKLNEQSRYDVVRISSLAETVHLNFSPPATIRARSYVSEQQRLSAVELATRQLGRAGLLEDDAYPVAKGSARLWLRERIITNVSDSQLRVEAMEMYRCVETLNNSGNVSGWLEMLQWIHEGEGSFSSLVDFSDRNFKISMDGATVGLMTISIDMKNNESMQEDDKKYVLWVDQIVTMPNTNGNGTALIAKAINSSEDIGCGGVVRVVDRSSSDFYGYLGFRQIKLHLFELDPTESNSWTKINGEWFFRAQ